MRKFTKQEVERIVAFRVNQLLCPKVYDFVTLRMSREERLKRVKRLLGK